MKTFKLILVLTLTVVLAPCGNGSGIKIKIVVGASRTSREILEKAKPLLKRKAMT